jgi:hypothetical protein
MDREPLDDLLMRSRPPQADLSDELRSLSEQMATDVARTIVRRRPRSPLAIAGLVLAGTLTLGAGAAVAVPLINPWWLWVPAEDLTISTGAFDQNGTLTECEITMRVLTDGQTAVVDSDRRLWEARRFLENVRSEDYAEAATILVESAQTDVFQQPYTYDAALLAVITDEFNERGLLGHGVSLESSVECEAM